MVICWVLNAKFPQEKKTLYHYKLNKTPHFIKHYKRTKANSLASTYYIYIYILTQHITIRGRGRTDGPWEKQYVSPGDPKTRDGERGRGGGGRGMDRININSSFKVLIFKPANFWGKMLNRR